jgi:signal transduction histidine kinase
LWSYDGQRFCRFGVPEGLPGAPIGALHFDSAGVLWLGTLGAGLGCYHHGRFVFADVRHGLDDEVISAILEDGRGYLWLASERGISRVRQQDLNEFMAGRCSQFESTHYGKNEGLDNVNSSGGFQPAAWRTRAGTLWFATSRGAVGVAPAFLRGSPQVPSLVLEGILVDKVDVTHQTSLQLPHDYRELEFRYSAPSLTAPERVRFRRQLVGLDPDWQAPTAARAATFSRLAPGRYEFRFTACNSDGLWNETPASVAFVVTPAWWQTAWFHALALLSCAAGLAGGVRYRYTRRMRRQLRQFEQAQAIEQERMRIARDIHDDLGARLTQMALLSEMAAGEIGTQGKASERLAKVAQSSREAMRALEETVWAINPHRDSLHDLTDYLSHYANEFFRPTPVRSRQDLPLLIPELQLPAEVRHNLFLACKEALNNIQKHAQATEVWLRLTVTDSRLDLLIEDNGLGFVLQPRPGNGLQNMQARLAATAGQCRIDSQPGRGTPILKKGCYRRPGRKTLRQLNKGLFRNHLGRFHWRG